MKAETYLESTGTQPAWVGVIRIFLGILLVWKALSFTRDASQLQTLAAAEFAGSALPIAAVVSIITLVISIFMMVGFFTRFISYSQIVIIVLALAFFYMTKMERSTMDIVSTLIIIPMLLFFGRKGGGPISFDEPLSHSSANIKKSGV